ncbi:hypothetical protein BDZ89DRAFT_1068623 [Hymenopellis radicata]|nr:hypothetical protein BDZ89DRAFT_1068623 [Hymenopellis radicata]
MLDLSPWKSALVLLQLSRFRLLVRQEYADFYDPLIEASKFENSLRVIMGSPGIGKSVFLIYILIRRLMAGQPTVLVLDDVPMLFRFDGTYTLITPSPLYDPLHVIESDNPSLRPWILIDAPKTPTLPAPWLTNPLYGFPILATSPEEQRYKSLLKYVANACLWIMQVWNEQDLMAVIPSLLDPIVGVDAKVVTTSLIQDYGHCIGDIARAIHSRVAVLRDREKALCAIKDQTPHCLFIVGRAGSIGDLALRDNHPYTVDIKSQAIFAALMQADLRISLITARQIYKACHSNMESNILAAWSYKRLTRFS